MQIFQDTFTHTETSELGVKRGTVEIEANGKREIAKASKFDDGTIMVQGFVGRYRTSPKPKSEEQAGA